MKGTSTQVHVGGGLLVPERALARDTDRRAEPRHGLFGCARPNPHFGRCICSGPAAERLRREHRVELNARHGA